MTPNARNSSADSAGDITSLLGKTLAYDTAGRLSEATGVPPCPTGVNCSGLQTTLSRYNGWGQRLLRENDREQSVFSYGLEGFTLLSQTTRRLATSQQSTTEHIWLPTASGPMPVAAVIDGVHYAVHADHLNTPRRLSDSTGQTKWQWPYSGFGEIAPQATPATGQAPLSFALRYPGRIDDGNELFYNWHRFYEPRVGRYTKADPIGLDGGWNRFGYVDAKPLGFVDPMGLRTMPSWWDDAWKPITPPGGCATPECAAGLPGGTAATQGRQWGRAIRGWLKDPANQCLAACDLVAASACKGYALSCGSAVTASTGPVTGAVAGVSVYGACNVGIHYYCHSACSNMGPAPSIDYVAP